MLQSYININQLFTKYHMSLKLDLEKKLWIFPKAHKMAKIDTKFKGRLALNMHEINDKTFIFFILIN